MSREVRVMEVRIGVGLGRRRISGDFKRQMGKMTPVSRVMM